MAKHRQGLSRLWGRDENFTTVMLVIHCGFTGKLYAAQHLGTFGEYGADCSLSVFPNGFGSQRFPYRSRLMRDSKPNVEVTNQREAHPKCSQHVKNSFHIFICSDFSKCDSCLWHHFNTHPVSGCQPRVVIVRHLDLQDHMIM